MNTYESSFTSKIYADFNAVRNGDGGHLFHLSCSAFEINISLEHSHFPIVPGFRSLAAWRSSAANSKVFVW